MLEPITLSILSASILRKMLEKHGARFTETGWIMRTFSIERDGPGILAVAEWNQFDADMQEW